MKSNRFEGEDSADKLVRFQKIGFYSLILDYLFIGYLIFRVHSIEYTFFVALHKAGLSRTSYEVTFAYIIPILSFPALFMLFLLFKTATERFREEAMVKKDAWMLTFRHFVIKSVIAFTFSCFFFSKIKQYIPYLPVDIQDNAIPAYYFSYIIMILYFVMRTFLSFEYYQALYLQDKPEYRVIFAASLIIFLSFTIHKLPYMIFLK